MDFFLYALFVIQSVYISIWCFKEYSRLLSVFSFFHFSYVGLILVGYFSVIRVPYPFDHITISYTLFYAILVQAAAFLGFNSRYNLFPSKLILFIFPNKGNNLKNVFRLGMFYSIVGLYSFYKYYSLPEEVLLTQHTGLPVLYLLFAKVVYVGHLLVLVTALKTNKKWTKRIALFLFCTILGILLFRLKRTETLVFISSTLFVLFYLKEFKVSRKYLLIGGGIFFLFNSYIIELRDQINVSFIQGKEISLSNLSSAIQQESLNSKITGAPELRYAISHMEIANDQFKFSYGAVHWNRMINLFVPAQIIGAGFKEDIKFYIPEYNAYKHFGEETFTAGLMNTIIGESFKEFWFFGVLFIFFLFNFLKKLAFNFEKFQYEYFLVFIALITPYSVAMTGSGTALYIGSSIFYFIYLLPLKILR